MMKLMAYTGVLKEYRGFYQPMQLSPECKRALRRSMPKDDTWIAVLGVLLIALVLIGVPTLFARWWLCL